ILLDFMSNNDDIESDVNKLYQLVADTPANNDELIQQQETTTHSTSKAKTPTKGYGRLLGCSTTMQEVYEKIQKVAPTSATVLLTGESGTGKEIVAQTLH